MAEKIGLEAALDMAGFSQALTKYIQGVTQAQRSTEAAAGAANRGSTSFSSFGIGVAAGIGSAVGQAAINALYMAKDAIIALSGEALQAVGSFEMMGLAFNNMVARDLARGKEVETTRQVVAQLTKKEADELDKLNQSLVDEGLDRTRLAAQIQEQRQRIIQLTASYGENGLNVQTAKARLAEMEEEYNKSGRSIDDMSARIAELNAKNGQLVTVTETTRVGQMSLTEAREKAIPIVKDLLLWTQKTAIMSPFTQEGVAGTFRLAQAYGFAAAAAKGLATGQAGITEAQAKGVMTAERLTQDIIDFTAGSGQTEAVAQRVALALGQIQARGKLAGQEVMQLTEAGISVDQILAEAFGKSRAEIVKMREAGLIPADKAIEAIAQSIEKDYGGAAARATGTISGLVSSLDDIKSMALRELFTATFEAFKPLVGGFVELAASDPEAAFAPLRNIGRIIGESVGQALSKVKDLIGAFQSGGLTGLAAAVGIPPDVLKGISELRRVLDMVIENAAAFRGALEGIGVVLAGAAIVGGIISLGTAIAALATPIGLIVVAAAAIGAAWETNFLGMRDVLTQFWYSTALPALEQLWQWIQVLIPIAIQYLSDYWQNILYPSLLMTANFIMNTVIPTMVRLYEWLRTNIPVAIQTVTDFWNNTLIPAFESVSAYITGTLIPSIMSIYTWLTTNITTAIQTVSAVWTGIFVPALTAVWTFISTYILPIFMEIGRILTTVLDIALTVSAGVWQNYLLPALQAVGLYLLGTILPFFQSTADKTNTVLTPAISGLAAIWRDTLYPALEKVYNFLQNQVLAAFEAVRSFVATKIGPALSSFRTGVLEKLNAAFETLKAILVKIKETLESVADALDGVQVPDALKPGSPTPFELGLRGISGAMSNLARKAGPALSSALSLTPAISQEITASRRLQTAFGGGGLAQPPLTPAGAGRGGVTVVIGPVTITNGMELAELGLFVRREVTAAMMG